MIDWNDPKCKISDHFTVKEAIWLPEWKRLGNLPEDQLTDEIKDNLVTTFKWMDSIREWAGAPINVHLAFRSMAYHLDLYKRMNEKNVANGKPEVHIPMGSMHLKGKAVDFDISGMSCDDAKQKILDDDKLEKMSLRMEKNGAGAGWVHLDDKAVAAGGNRYFIP